MGKQTRVRPRTRWRDYISDLAWSRLVMEPVKPSEDAENREVLRDFLGLFLRDPREKKSGCENERKLEKQQRM